MKIPQKVGYGLIATGIAGFFGSSGAGFYFANKIGEAKENSPEHVRVAEIEQESSKLKEDLLVNCLENNSDEKPYNTCIVQAANQYRPLQLEKRVLMQSDSYNLAEEKIGTYHNHMIGSAVGVVVLPFLFGLVGLEVVSRRRREETDRVIEKFKQEFLRYITK